MILSIINELADNPSLLAKEAILLREKDNELLRKVFLLAYDSTKNFFLSGKNIHVSNPPAIASSTLEESLKIFIALSSRSITGNLAIQKFEEELSVLSEQDQIVMLRILNRDLRCNTSGTLCNKVWSNGKNEFIPTYPFLLCQKDSLKTRAKINFPANIQRKYDGLRVNAIVNIPEFGEPSVEFITRNGKNVNCGNAQLKKELYELCFKIGEQGGCIFDGELLVLDGMGNPLDRKTSNGLANKATKGVVPLEVFNNFAIYVWDYITFQEYDVRKSTKTYDFKFETIIRGFKDGSFDRIIPAHYDYVNSWEEATAFYDQQRKMGHEGAIIKNMKLKWEDSRSSDCVKMKAFDTLDMRIIGWKEGKGKHAGVMGAWLVSTDDGKIVSEVGIGYEGSLDDHHRALFTEEYSLGKIVEIGYNEIISKKSSPVKSLFLPQFICFRFDKDTTD